MTAVETVHFLHQYQYDLHEMYFQPLGQVGFPVHKKKEVAMKKNIVSQHKSKSKKYPKVLHLQHCSIHEAQVVDIPIGVKTVVVVEVAVMKVEVVIVVDVVVEGEVVTVAEEVVVVEKAVLREDLWIGAGLKVVEDQEVMGGQQVVEAP